LTLILQHIVYVVSKRSDNSNNICLAAMVCVAVLWSFCNIFIAGFSINAPNQNDETIFQSLLNIPKNHVSSKLSNYKSDMHKDISCSSQDFEEVIRFK
jgi:hypothetical protein